MKPRQAQLPCVHAVANERTECNDLLTTISIQVFLMENSLEEDSPARPYLTRIKKDLSEAHFLAAACQVATRPDPSRGKAIRNGKSHTICS